MSESHVNSNLTSEAEKIAEALEAKASHDVSESWFIDWSHLLDSFNDIYIRALWRHYSDMTNEEASNTYRVIVQSAMPRFDKADQVLSRLASQFKAEAPALQRIIDKKAIDAQLYTPATAELEAEIETLVSRHRSLISKQLVSLEKPITLAEVRARLRKEADRKQREWMWRQREQRRAEDFAEEEEIFLKMYGKRMTLAKAVGFKSFRDFMWKSKHRNDYTPEEALQLLDQVKAIFGDTHKKFASNLAKVLGVKELRPWDLEVTQSNIENPKALTEEALLKATRQALVGVSPEFAPVFDRMKKLGHIELMSRPSKVGMNFSTTLTTTPDPFVMCNATGAPTDFRVILHEFGHALHYASSVPNKLFFEKVAPVEILEFVAYTIQILGSNKLADLDVLSPEEEKAHKFYVLDVVLRMLRTYDSVERFQHWLYEKERSIDEMDNMWLHLNTESIADWSGLEKHQAKGWHHSHVFGQPFYSIEYIISWLAALVVTDKMQDKHDLPKEFLTLLSFGGSKGVKESLATLNIIFPFEEDFVEQARDALHRNFMTEL